MERLLFIRLFTEVLDKLLKLLLNMDPILIFKTQFSFSFFFFFDFHFYFFCFFSFSLFVAVGSLLGCFMLIVNMVVFYVIFLLFFFFF